MAATREAQTNRTDRRTFAAARALAVLAAAFVASFALAATAFAAPAVQGADFHATGSALESGEVDVLTVAGQTGDTVFVSVKQGSRDIAKFIPYTLGEGVTKGEGDNWTGVVTLDISAFDPAKLDGTYTVEAYATRAGGDPIYAGALLGAYADLPDGTVKLIGTRTAGATDPADRTFQANDTLYADGRTYRLSAAEPEVADDGTLHFAYEEYDEATTVDGVVKYVDKTGTVLATQKIAGIPYGGTRVVDIPATVTAENGDLYRTVFFKDSVTAENPGATSFTIACAKMTEADKAAANYYVATIQLVDQDGHVIATDSVNVTGLFRYTAPTTIYKTEAVAAAGGEDYVVTYDVVGDPHLTLSAADDGVTGGARVVVVSYEAQEPDPPELDVTFNLIDGTKRVSDKDRQLGTKVTNVNLQDETAVPDAVVEAGGQTYNLVGDPSDYAYSLRSGKVPVVNAYYTPEGYEPPGPYDVEVNYVNFLTGEVVQTVTYTSDPSDNANMEIETPATFSAGGVDYVRLDGQERAISHSYYSGISSYTVYYRDKDDELTSGTVINTIRVVYAGEAAGSAGEADTGAAAGGDAGDAGAGTDLAAAANNAAMQLNGSRTYNVLDGEGNNATLTNESGVDSNSERIEDEETPLASGLSAEDGPDGAAGAGGVLVALVPAWALPAGIGAVLAAVAAVAVVFAVRRKRNDREEA